MASFIPSTLLSPYQYRYPTWFYVLKMFLFGGQRILRKYFFARRWEKKGSVCSFYDSVSTKLLCKASSPSPFQLHLDWCLLGAPRWTPILWCVLAEQHSAAYSDHPKIKRISGQDNNLVINKLHCNPIKKTPVKFRFFNSSMKYGSSYFVFRVELGSTGHQDL